MIYSDERFFEENVVKVNKTVERILFLAMLVPLSFIILTLVHVWIVPHGYSLIILGYELVVSIIAHFLNKSKKMAYFSMYFGLVATIIFVDLLGVKDVIIVTISFASPSFLSCLYYNKRLTNVITIVSFLSLIIVYWIKAVDA